MCGPTIVMTEEECVAHLQREPCMDCRFTDLEA